MVERQEHIPLWMQALASGRIDKDALREALHGYKAGLDLPFSGWCKELMEMYPKAKVVLTVRDPQKWYTSAHLLYDQLNGLVAHFPYSFFLRLVGLGNVVAYLRQEGSGTREGSLPETAEGTLNNRMGKALRGGEQHAVKFFSAHIEEVRATVPPEQLLVFDVKEGWTPLCQFLQVPVPDVPFPNINDANEIRYACLLVKLLSWGSMLVAGFLLFYVLKVLVSSGGNQTSVSSTSLIQVLFPALVFIVILWLSNSFVTRVVRNQTEKSKMH